MIARRGFDSYCLVQAQADVPHTTIEREHFVQRLRPESGRRNHRRLNNFWRTSAQETADDGFFRCSVHRRSNSAASSAVRLSCVCCSASVRLSQSVIASSARSFGGRLNNSEIDGVGMMLARKISRRKRRVKLCRVNVRLSNAIEEHRARRGSPRDALKLEDGRAGTSRGIA